MYIYVHKTALKLLLLFAFDFIQKLLQFDPTCIQEGVCLAVGRLLGYVLQLW